MTTCSPAHRVAKPQRSAADATASITARLAPLPMPSASNPSCIAPSSHAGGSAAFQQLREHRGLADLEVAGGGHKRDVAALAQRAQLLQCRAVTQLGAVARGEFVEPLRFMPVPLAQFCR